MKKLVQPIKMSVSVFLCILFYHLFFTANKDNLVLISTVSAVYASRDRLTDVLDYAKARVIGTAIGCTTGSIYLVIQHYIDIPISSNFIIPLFVFSTVLICGGEKNNTIVRGAIMPLLTLTLLTPPSKDLSFVQYRILATIIGLLISFVCTFTIDAIVGKITKTNSK